MSRPKWETAVLLIATILAGGGTAILNDHAVTLAPILHGLCQYSQGAGAAVILFLMRPQQASAPPA